MPELCYEKLTEEVHVVCVSMRFQLQSLPAV